MRRSASLLALASLCALSSPTAAQTENLPPVAPQAVGAAAKSCAAAMSAAGVDHKRLVADGWSEGKFEANDADGQQVPGPLRIFSRDPGALVLLEAQPPAERVTCIVMARIASVADYQAVIEAALAALSGRVVQIRQPTVLVAFPESKMAEIAPAGSTDKPAIRILMMHISERR